jgi:hypothetical protein
LIQFNVPNKLNIDSITFHTTLYILKFSFKASLFSFDNLEIEFLSPKTTGKYITMAVKKI